MAAEVRSPAGAPRGATREKIRWIWDYWRPHRGALVFLFLFTLVSSGVTIAYPLVWKVVLDHLTRAGAGAQGAGRIPPKAVANVLWILAAIALGRFVAGFYPAFRQWMNLRIDVAVREKVFSGILGKDYRFFNRFATGDLVTRLLDDISEYPKIAWFCCSGIFRAVDSGSKLLFCVACMLFLDARLALLSLMPLPIMMYIIYRVRSQLTEAAERSQRAISETNDMLEKTFSGIRIVKAFCSEPGQTRALDRILVHRIGVQYRYQRLWALLSACDTVASRAGQLVVLAVGGVMAVRGEITPGTIYAFYIYLDMLVQPMWDLPNLVVTSRQTFVCIDREEELMRFPVAVSHPVAGRSVAQMDTLEFDQVSFGYDGARPALDDVSFQVRRGETVALVGPVAAGKSTILKLACGLLVPDRGVVRVNGRPASEYDWRTYQRLVGYTPQDSLLFSESIRENVAMGRSVPGGAEHGDPATADWARRVLSVAQMREDLEQMPHGIETVLGQKGSKVSGGQRQRISMARALYHRPAVLLLDDCTASLDADNEDRLWDGIRSLLPDATVILVSHRLATIRRAEWILLLDRGRVCDRGTHEELAQRCEEYRRFLELADERETILGAAELATPP